MNILLKYRKWIINKKKSNQLNEWRKKGIIVPDSFLWEEQIRLDISNPFFKIDGGSIEIGENVKISKGVIIDCFGGKVKIGNNVFIGPYTVIYGHGNVTIGDDCLIAMRCNIISASHTIPNQFGLIRNQPDKLGEVIIHEDVWIGAGSTILYGVKIGPGSVISANSVIKKNIEKYSIIINDIANIAKTRIL